MCVFVFPFAESSKEVTEWAQFLVKITRTYVFICDHCRSHIVKAGACACSLSSLGNTSCACVCMCAYHFILPPCLFSCFGCFGLFHFSPLTPRAGTNSGSLCSPSDLPSVQRIRWVGKCWEECQALSRKPGFCFISLLNRSHFLFLCPRSRQPPSPLSFLHAIFHRIHVGWEQRQRVRGLCVAQHS